MRPVRNGKGFLKYTSRSTHKIFDKNHAAIHEIKPVSLLNKPIYVGFTVLELSRWFTYEFNYNFIKKYFDAELLFTDTDSLTFEYSKWGYQYNFKSVFFLWKMFECRKSTKRFSPSQKFLCAKKILFLLFRVCLFLFR